MLDPDKQILHDLVKEYSPIELISELVIALREHRDNLSDMGLKERVPEMSEAVIVLAEARDFILGGE